MIKATTALRSCGPQRLMRVRQVCAHWLLEAAVIMRGVLASAALALGWSYAPRIHYACTQFRGVGCVLSSV